VGEGTKLGTGCHPQIPLSKILGNSTEISAYIDKGYLVPDELVMQQLLATLLIPATAGMSGSAVLVDGFPRTPTQADLVKLLHEKSIVRPHPSLATPLVFDGEN
jgi:adenylate kinase family enzyme